VRFPPQFRAAASLSMTALKLTVACRDYEHTRALARGEVGVHGAEIEFVHLSPPSRIFRRMLESEEFDAAEMSLSNFMIALARGDRRFVGLPVFPYRAFRHSHIWVRRAGGVEAPRDLRGRRVGVPDYSMTALLFVRGMLRDDYGVVPEEIRWRRARSEHVPFAAPEGVEIENIPPGETLEGWLAVGKLDAMVSTTVPASFERGEPWIRRLFSNPREVEADYYRRTAIFPIMHLLVVKRGIYERHSWLAAALTEAFEAAKQFSFRRFQEGFHPLPWIDLAFEQAREVIGPDPYPYGIGANRPTLEAAARFAHEQGLTPRKLAVEELFAPETLGERG
jgi:4,5-dihydroxyphthalate decarboxylase